MSVKTDMDHHIEQVEGPLFRGFYAPSNCWISGVTGSGKTSLVHRILVNKDVLYSQPVRKVLYCMSVDQPLYDKMRKTVPGLKFHRGLPNQEDLDQFTDGSHHTLVVLDDLMESVVKSVHIQNLFTKYSHHNNISVIYINQNMYASGPCARNLSLNTQYFIALSNPRDVGQIDVLARQTSLGKLLKDSYRDGVMSKRYGYIVISLHPADVSAPDATPRLRARIHTDIFPGESLVSYV